MDQILFNEKCRSGLDGGALDYSSQLKISIRGKINPIMFFAVFAQTNKLQIGVELIVVFI